MENQKELRQGIRKSIENFRSAQDIYALFKYLNYPEEMILNESYKRKKSNFSFKKDDSEKINEIFMVLNIKDNLPVFLLEVKTLSRTFVKSIATTFDKQYLQFFLILTIDYNELIFLLPERERKDVGKYKLKITKLILNKDELHYTEIETLSNIYIEKEKEWREIWQKWKKAFSVERVTKIFFEDYKRIFFLIRDKLIKENNSRKESHEFTLQLLNRLMFIYFISKKGWLKHSKFINWFWTSYKKLNKYNLNEFYSIWLKQLFFKGFNNRAKDVSGLTDVVKKVLLDFPYLNGGLFNKNEIDDLEIIIEDALFQQIFVFFENYNFTIKEDMPLEVEVAIDPQMIGYVYESLANVAEEIYDRNELGIFYTPRVEVDFMCRRSLVEYLAKHLPEIPKEDFYHFLFDAPEEKERIRNWGDDKKIWLKIENTLNKLSVVDPACGSGAFLVGMLNVLTELYKIVFKYTNRNIDDYNLKNRIIQNSLYGVDVMPWAIHAAELRLWLQLIIETDLKKETLTDYPLLPNLNINLRIGDSLVQEIGGFSLNIRSSISNQDIKKKLDILKEEKRKYFENSKTAIFDSLESIKEEEIRIFTDIINFKIEEIKRKITKYEKNIIDAKSQKTLTGEFLIDENKVKENKIKIEENENEIKKIEKIIKYLDVPEKKPFVWDIDFAEIFGEKNGFDIVIGNPPYVRQELISPPNKLKTEVILKQRREYKDKLINSVKNLFPGKIKRINKKSDYYIYFYFHGLGLLNEKGTFCFITSNSWLDANYGKELQEFLLKYVHIEAIYDNPKRSFSQ